MLTWTPLGLQFIIIHGHLVWEYKQNSGNCPLSRSVAGVCYVKQKKTKGKSGKKKKKIHSFITNKDPVSQSCVLWKKKADMCTDQNDCLQADFPPTFAPQDPRQAQWVFSTHLQRVGQMMKSSMCQGRAGDSVACLLYLLEKLRLWKYMSLGSKQYTNCWELAFPSSSCFYTRTSKSREHVTAQVWLIVTAWSCSKASGQRYT